MIDLFAQNRLRLIVLDILLFEKVKSKSHLIYNNRCLTAKFDNHPKIIYNINIVIITNSISANELNDLNRKNNNIGIYYDSPIHP
jgi:hypothetical protein